MKSQLTRWSLLSAVIALFTFSACKKDKTPAKANVLVTHASPDAPGVDLLVDNVKVNSSALTFPNNTGYLQVNEGTRNIKVNASGTSTSVINADISFSGDKSYSLFAYKQLAQIGAILVADDLTTPASGKAHIRFFHLSPDAPGVDVGILNGSTFTPVFANRSFETQTTASANAAFTPVNAGTYTFQVRVAGTSTAALTIPGVTLEAGKIYTVFARGLLAGSGAQALNASVIINK